MLKSLANLPLVVVCCASVASPLLASIAYHPPRWLDQGGLAADHSPEFYWTIEVAKIAAAFKPTQTRVARPVKDNEEVSFAEQASALDLADYEQTKPSAESLAKHRAARDAIAAANETTTAALPDEDASEFADYHRGAFAFHLGQKHYAEAVAAWEALLKRPETERRYRSVWAAFMLGKVSLITDKNAEAVKWFRTTRDLAKQGTVDSLGLAADSYGWEALAELHQDHLEKAAQLYLTQLALGDASALTSLKVLVADNSPITGMVDYVPAPPESADQAAKDKFEADRAAATKKKMVRSASDPLLRRITTAHVLATETVGESLYFDYGTEKTNRCQDWLAAIEEAKVGQVDDAAQLGWVAYTSGDYKEAARWLKLDAGTSAEALWLKAKLLRRDGKLKEATTAMSNVWQLLRETRKAPAADENGAFDGYFRSGLSPEESASGDLGALHLSRGEFVSAYEAFDEGNMVEDAAFVAEHVLTADEFKKAVDKLHPNPGKDEDKIKVDEQRWGPTAPDTQQRWMLARRLVREDRYAEARPYFPPAFRELLDRYTKALADGANEKLPKLKRARAWFDAAMIARRQGMELMGTEVEPDNFISGGDFEATDVAGERESGASKHTSYEDGKEVTKTVKLAVAATKEELQRLAKNKPAPNKRFHYRYIAAALGWKAAQLLPDNSDELADVLNTSGRWIKNDDKAADKYFQAIEHRAAKTETGKEAGAKHWFVERYGPWSEEPKE